MINLHWILIFNTGVCLTNSNSFFPFCHILSILLFSGLLNLYSKQVFTNYILDYHDYGKNIVIKLDVLFVWTGCVIAWLVIAWEFLETDDKFVSTICGTSNNVLQKLKQLSINDLKRCGLISDYTFHKI